MPAFALLQSEEKVLHETAAPVPERLFGTPELADIIAGMAEAMDAEQDGVAIAAPQVGIPYRIFLVRYDRMAPLEEGEKAGSRKAEVGVFINPVLTKLSRKAVESDEGCLSVRGVYGKTKRKERATVEAYDENGVAFTRGAGGILAQAFQHEVDHLNGILFIDHATKLYAVKDRAAADESDD